MKGGTPAKKLCMSQTDAIDLYRGMVDLGIRIWIDGGWGVDALLGRQTREHNDLDIVLLESQQDALLAHLTCRRYREVPKADSRAWNFVLGDDLGHEIDLHVIVLDDAGNGLYGPASANESMYPAQALTGRGLIDGVPVLCTSAEFQLQSHSGYTLTAKDFHDMQELSAYTGLPL